MSNRDLQQSLENILEQYQKSFSRKIYKGENNDIDLLMRVFSITPEIKRENRQYWGRELGMCWQLLVTRLFESTRPDFSPAIRFGKDEPADFFFGQYAVDTKYRIGSGDSGTLKKFKRYGTLLHEQSYTPIFLILREDNLPAAITACKTGSWLVLTHSETFSFIHKHTGFDLENYLTQIGGDYEVDR